MDHPGDPDPALPLADFENFLSQLHDGPPQHAAALRVALAVWQGAVDRGDVAQAREALAILRGELDHLIESLSAVQDRGRSLLRQHRPAGPRA